MLLYLLPRTTTLQVHIHNVVEAVSEALFPSVCVPILLRQISIVCGNVETELSIRCSTLCMQGGKLLAEVGRLWEFFSKFIELAKIVVRVWDTFERTPSNRLGAEATHNGMDC